MHRKRMFAYLVRHIARLGYLFRRTRPTPRPYLHPPSIVAVTKLCTGIPKHFARAAHCASHLTRCTYPNRYWARLLVEEVTRCPGPGDAALPFDACMCN